MNRCARALISVSDKSGLAEFAAALAQLGIEIVSTGGTAAALREAGLEVTDVSAVTGFPEIMDGRVKTLHPKIHGGLLGRRDLDAEIMAEMDIAAIDLLVVNLYPFESTITAEDCSEAAAIEQIDIGGPAMLRAAAKNHTFVTVVIDPADYGLVVDELRNEAATVSAKLRRRLAAKAFAHTARYDAVIAGYLEPRTDDDALPADLVLALKQIHELRYGENPHQRAALYVAPEPPAGTVVSAHQHQGKALSYNNITDADAALECVRAMPATTCVIVKHANPCGVGCGATPVEAYERAYATDPTSAFGGVIAFNVPVDRELAALIIERQFVEVIIAPTFTTESLEVFAAKAGVRVLETGELAAPAAGLRLQQVEGGVLIQDKDVHALDPADMRTVTRRAPTQAELADARLAWEVVRFVKSNAIVYCRAGATLGIGAGQMSRVVSARIAALKAGEAGLDLRGATMASDAFFPFRDGIDAAASHRISMVIQPGGSVRDEEVIAAADEHDMAMVFTGIRHFRH